MLSTSTFEAEKSLRHAFLGHTDEHQLFGTLVVNLAEVGCRFGGVHHANAQPLNNSPPSLPAPDPFPF